MNHRGTSMVHYIWRHFLSWDRVDDITLFKVALNTWWNTEPTRSWISYMISITANCTSFHSVFPILCYQYTNIFPYDKTISICLSHGLETVWWSLFFRDTALHVWLQSIPIHASEHWRVRGCITYKHTGYVLTSSISLSTFLLPSWLPMQPIMESMSRCSHVVTHFMVFLIHDLW